MKIPYLEWFVNEVLRMFPIAPLATSRECNTTSVICGHTIEEGSVIQADMYTIHYDPDLWGPEDPNKFIPERHATPRHPPKRSTAQRLWRKSAQSENCGANVRIIDAVVTVSRNAAHYDVATGMMWRNFAHLQFCDAIMHISA